MTQFRFRLATLLRLRESLRDEKRSELALALQADVALEERIRGIEDDLADLLAAAKRGASPGAINIDRLLNAQRYELLLRAEQQIAEEQRRLLAHEIERRREALVAADREVKVLEKYRAVQQERHRTDVERKEQAQLDETALRRFAVEEAR